MAYHIRVIRVEPSWIEKVRYLNNGLILLENIRKWTLYVEISALGYNFVWEYIEREREREREREN